MVRVGNSAELSALTEKEVTARGHVKGEPGIRRSHGLFNCFLVKDCVARFD